LFNIVDQEYIIVTILKLPRSLLL